ncbi:hypothetical protein AB0L70_32420 [Kribbella sp. NPDC051952]|uniref:hypothetical protein n=1 Tax=Kribbella sp. NPDC051952 TaxID=3154851 RepID=UPI003426852C
MLNKILAVVVGASLATTAVVLTAADQADAATPVLMGVHGDIAPKELAKRYPGVKATREFVNGVQGTKVDLRKKYDGVAKASWTGRRLRRGSSGSGT